MSVESNICGTEINILMTVVNVYAPQSGRLVETPDELHQLYADLNDLCEEFDTDRELLFLQEILTLK